MDRSASRSPTDANQAWYETRAARRQQAGSEHLEAPELALLETLGPELAGMRMLDLGVGTGRTGIHFAPLVKEYVGVDYSQALIAICKRRLDRVGGSVSLHHGDARHLSMFAAASFDLVLFSVNSLDCLDHCGRLEALAEIGRVTAPGGIFFFSFHNLGAIDQALSPASRFDELRRSRSSLRLPLAVARHLPAQILQRVANPDPEELRLRHWVWLSKGWPPRAPRMTYHVTLPEARRQLLQAGFAIDKILLPSGCEVAYSSDHLHPEQRWLNLWCRRSRTPDSSCP